MDIEQRFLIPLPGLLVRDPRTKTPLPMGGAIVSWTGPEGRYWRRRVQEGSCTEGSPPLSKEPEKSETIIENETIVTKERKIRRY